MRSSVPCRCRVCRLARDDEDPPRSTYWGLNLCMRRGQRARRSPRQATSSKGSLPPLDRCGSGGDCYLAKTVRKKSFDHRRVCSLAAAAAFAEIYTARIAMHACSRLYTISVCPSVSPSVRQCVSCCVSLALFRLPPLQLIHRF